MGNTIGIVVADANFLIRHGLKYIIESTDNLDLLHETDNSESLSQLIKQYKPDILIFGLNMDSTSPCNGIDDIIAEFPELKILVVDNIEDRIKTVKIIQTGVHGYILKTCDKEEILEAFDTILKDKKFFCSNVIKIESDVANGSLSKLSDREVEVLKLISNGMTNNEIAKHIYLSAHTVATHRKNLMKKLHAKNNVDLVICAIKESIIQP